MDFLKLAREIIGCDENFIITKEQLAYLEDDFNDYYDEEIRALIKTSDDPNCSNEAKMYRNDYIRIARYDDILMAVLKLDLLPKEEMIAVLMQVASYGHWLEAVAYCKHHYTFLFSEYSPPDVEIISRSDGSQRALISDNHIRRDYVFPNNK